MIINLDLDNLNSPTSVGYQVPPNVHDMYFRIIENNKIIDYSTFEKLELNIQLANGQLYVRNTDDVVTVDDEELVKFNLTDTFTKTEGFLTITPKVEMLNKITILSSFKALIHNGSDSQINNIFDVTANFNNMLYQYYNSVKQSEKNQPNGVPQLDMSGKVPLELMPDQIRNHIANKMVHTHDQRFYNSKGEFIGIHGLDIRDDWKWTYLDTDAQRWYRINEVNGGEFGYNHKPSEYDIHGGKFGFEPYPESVTDPLLKPIHGGTWD